MARKEKQVPAVAYMRTSSATNVGADKDSERRQRAAIEGYAKSAGYLIASDDWFYDAAVSGTDPVNERAGFKAMLDRIASNGVRVIVIESPDRFARDLAVQLAGHDFLKSLGVVLIPATAPDFFTEDTPTAVLVRQVLGAIAQFDKTSLVAKLRAARERKKALTGKCGGRKSIAELDADAVSLAKALSRSALRMNLREIASELAARGHLPARGKGKPYSPAAIKSMLRTKRVYPAATAG